MSWNDSAPLGVYAAACAQGKHAAQAAQDKWDAHASAKGTARDLWGSDSAGTCKGGNAAASSGKGTATLRPDSSWITPSSSTGGAVEYYTDSYGVTHTISASPPPQPHSQPRPSRPTVTSSPAQGDYAASADPWGPAHATEIKAFQASEGDIDEEGFWETQRHSRRWNKRDTNRRSSPDKGKGKGGPCT